MVWARNEKGFRVGNATSRQSYTVLKGVYTKAFQTDVASGVVSTQQAFNSQVATYDAQVPQPLEVIASQAHAHTGALPSRSHPAAPPQVMPMTLSLGLDVPACPFDDSDVFCDVTVTGGGG